MVLQCHACGAQGEDSFSKTDLGDMVCNLCGTQCFLQNRNETQDAEDTGAAGMSRRVRKQRRRKSVRGEPSGDNVIRIEACLRACQKILARQTESLVHVCGCPPKVATIARDIWFAFLRAWENHGTRPLLHCFTDYIMKAEVLEKAVPSGYRVSTYEDRRRKNTRNVLDKFTYVHLLSISYLACRYANNGVIPADICRWAIQQRIPYFQTFYDLTKSEQQVLHPVRHFFLRGANYPKAAVVDNNAAYFQSMLHLHAPPLNAPLAAFNMITSLNLPKMVFANYLKITGYVETSTTLNILNRPDLLYRNCPVGVAAFIVAAIKICPSWLFWVHKENPDFFRTPWSESDLAAVKRKDLERLMDFCNSAVSRREIPNEFIDHIRELAEEYEGNILSNSESKASSSHVKAFWPKYDDGVPVHENPSEIVYPSNVLYYPQYKFSACHHAALERLVHVLSEWIDAPPQTLMHHVKVLDDSICESIPNSHCHRYGKASKAFKRKRSPEELAEDTTILAL